MSRFYGSIEGDKAKTEATRQGTQTIHSHTRGWNAGVAVTGTVKGDHDVFDIRATHGSSGSGHTAVIAQIETDNHGGAVLVRLFNRDTGEQLIFTLGE